MLSEKDWRQISEHPLLRTVSKELICGHPIGYGDGTLEFPDGETIETSNRIGFILSGRAAVWTDDDSRRVLLRFLNTGDAFGVAGVFSPSSNGVSKICAHGVCRCFFLSESTVSHLLDISDSFRKNYIGFLGDRIRYLNQKINYLTAGSAERRLALYLISLGTTEVELKGSVSALSDLLNLGRASLYRAFDKLCEDGYLQKDGKRITLLNTEAMLNAYK